MNLRWIKYLIIGLILAGVIILAGVALFNVVVNKIPIFGSDKPTALPQLNTKNRPVNFTEIAIDDLVRENLLTEDQAWEYAWAYYTG